MSPLQISLSEPRIVKDRICRDSTICLISQSGFSCSLNSVSPIHYYLCISPIFTAQTLLVPHDSTLTRNSFILIHPGPQSFPQPVMKPFLPVKSVVLVGRHIGLRGVSYLSCNNIFVIVLNLQIIIIIIIMTIKIKIIILLQYQVQFLVIMMRMIMICLYNNNDYMKVMILDKTP